MAEVKESSVLFSLNQLMKLEQQRQREEEEAARARADAERTARAEAERRARDEEAARLHAEAERRRIEEARRREEAARLEAIRDAALEKARVEAEQRARIEAMASQQLHERELVKLSQDAQKRRLQRFVSVSGVLGVLVLGATFGAYFGKIKPEAEQAQAEQAIARAAQEKRLAELKAELDARDKQVGEVVLALEATRSAAEKAELQRKLDDARRDRDAIQGRVSSNAAALRPPPGPEKCVCREGDPMCGCLP